MNEKYQKKTKDSILNNKDVFDIDEANQIIDAMQMHNYNCDYDKTIELYGKYKSVFSNDAFFSNKLLSEYELATHKIILDSKPRNIMVILTNICDIRCIMCHQDRTPLKNIDKKIVDIVLSNLQYTEKLIWQGGEVLTLPYFKDILVKTINYPRIRYTVISNFQNISDEIIELISKNNIDFIISIDSIIKEKYEKIRIGASFDRLEKNIKKLNDCMSKSESKVYLQINFVIMPMNYKEIPDIIDFAHRYNFSTVAFLRCITDNESLKITKEYEKDVMEYIKLAKEKADKYNIRIINTFAEFNNNDCKNDTIKDYIVNSQNENKGLFCHLPWYGLLILEDNTVKPHSACGYTSFVNIDSYNNINDIWNNEVMQNYRKQMLKHEYGSCIRECRLMLSHETRKKFNK
ncbi:MAG: radical SAM protein [Endomicrobiaceae bacterium]|jgi:MoaA/NifB/PqqE/SkfB family radical SAM enzyme|nr:radical SAM protein [Endomicrobiaceae bacterium]MDD3729770.1 radical SAM protein [Endomicrobiaceae bacterium]MDD4166024.1 radical SAM protein [Endomicrobiaceae bacterium]